MPPDYDTRNQSPCLNYRDGAVVPARHVSLKSRTLLRHDRHRVRVNKLLAITFAPQIDAREFAPAAYVFNHAEAVTEIVCDEKRVAVRSDRNPSRINRRAIAVVAR